ncbi:MAG: 2-oxo acid dehydrogenase subunit E2 [Anaerolineae bacterium]|nr:2-oxo acid dehydrogenase subunit E2 [Anaerolineae bacterium]MDW8171285.1 dihydrolipoamide acetyltransferase family protein [Anaerolineae bacterium]
MVTRIIMPQLGESVVEGTVGEWLKKVGETVQEFESIVRVSTDKVDTEIPSPASGVLLRIDVAEGQTVQAGVLLGLIGQPDEALPAAEAPAPALRQHPAPVPGQAVFAPAQPSVTSGTRAYAGHVTPVVARMAAEHGLDLSQIRGTGRDGRITKKDVEAYLAQRSAAPQPAAELPPWEQPGSGDLFKPLVEYTLPPPPVAPPTPAQFPARPSSARAAAEPVGKLSGELIPLSAMRRSIAEHMVASKLHIAPHATTVFEADMSAVVAHREAHRGAAKAQGIKLTYTAYFVAAIVEGLRAYPILNARWTDEGIYMQRPLNIGMATALEDGLIVPVIKNAQDYNLFGLARQINDLAERARLKRLSPDEVRDGTFTLTNHGVSGSLFATPIINQPQSAILGVGVMEKRVKVIDDMIAIRPCVYLSLSFDHRLIDGATADGFMSVVKAALESWRA